MYFESILSSISLLLWLTAAIFVFWSTIISTSFCHSSLPLRDYDQRHKDTDSPLLLYDGIFKDDGYCSKQAINYVLCVQKFQLMTITYHLQRIVITIFPLDENILFIFNIYLQRPTCNQCDKNTKNINLKTDIFIIITDSSISQED